MYRSGLESKNLIFIVGHYKSGSTWLLNLLSRHPGIQAINETFIFHHVMESYEPRQCVRKLYRSVPWSRNGVRNLLSYRLLQWSAPLFRRWRPSLGLSITERPANLLDLSLVDQLSLKKILLQSGSREEFCERFFDVLYGRFHPACYLLEKTPRHIHCIPFIREVFPEAKLISIYRDGRDVVVSSRFFLENISKKNSPPLDESIKLWRRDMIAQFSFAEKYGIFSCSYENLKTDGVGVVRELLSVLELPIDLKVIHSMLERSSFRFLTGRQPGKEDRKKFIRKGISGDWKNHFSEDDKTTFKRIAGDILIQLGYERDYEW